MQLDLRRIEIASVAARREHRKVSTTRSVISPEVAPGCSATIASTAARCTFSTPYCRAISPFRLGQAGHEVGGIPEVGHGLNARGQEMAQTSEFARDPREIYAVERLSWHLEGAADRGSSQTVNEGRTRLRPLVWQGREQTRLAPHDGNPSSRERGTWRDGCCTSNPHEQRVCTHHRRDDDHQTTPAMHAKLVSHCDGLYWWWAVGERHAPASLTRMNFVRFEALERV